MRVTDIIAPPFTADGTITLDETQRNRRRIKMTSDQGVSFLLDLPEAELLRHGEGLRLDDGSIVQIQAAPEKLYILRMGSQHELTKLAWQLGNRHLPAQILSDRIIIRQDHVIRDMVEKFGASVEELEAAFDPETGAYHASKSHKGHHHD